jgi:hypothetical protein
MVVDCKILQREPYLKMTLDLFRHFHLKLWLWEHPSLKPVPESCCLYKDIQFTAENIFREKGSSMTLLRLAKTLVRTARGDRTL